MSVVAGGDGKAPVGILGRSMATMAGFIFPALVLEDWFNGHGWAISRLRLMRI
jgi:hypothetical protein